MTRKGDAGGRQSPQDNSGLASWPWLSSPWLAMAIIVLAGLLAFSNNYRGEFIYDDFDAIVDNPAIKTLSPFWSPLLITSMAPVSGRPVIALTFALNYAVGGLNVFGYHLVNNIIHILVGLALFGIVRATLLLPRFATNFAERATGFGLAVALLWLLHPLQTEAVDFITQRTETLASLFYLSTILFSIKAFSVDSPRRWYTAAVVACALGMGSKEIMVSAPLLVLFYDRLMVSGSFRATLRGRRWFYACLGATWLILGSLQVNAPHGTAIRFDGFGSLNVYPLDYFRTQLGVVTHYLRLAFWPHPLALSYQDLPMMREFSAPLILPALIISALIGLTFWGLLRGQWWSIVGLFFFAIISPSSSIIPMPYEIATERRMYLPLAAVIVSLVFTYDHLWTTACDRGWVGIKWRRYGGISILALLLPAMACATWLRNGDYRTAVSIWQDTVQTRPGNVHALESLGKALVDEGRIDEAIGPFQEAARLKPNDAEIFSNLGSALGQLGRFDEAIAMHRKALTLESANALDHYYMGNTYLRFNDMENAVLAFREALKIDPNSPFAHGNLGLVLMKQGDLAGAEIHFEKLLGLMPRDLSSYKLLGELRLRQDRSEEAAQLYRQALAIAPGDAEITERLNALLARKRQ